nr:uncharacterized protein LOC117860741 [Setaria viridis]
MARNQAILQIHLFQRWAPGRELPEDVVVDLGVGQLQDLEVPGDERRGLQPREAVAMSNQMNDSNLPLDGGTDPGLGVVLIEGAVDVARPQAERVHGRGRIAVSEEAAHEAGELLGRVVAVGAAGTEAEVDAGRGRPEVAPPPRQHADYQNTKCYTKKMKKSGKSIPQLGQQSNQSIAPLVVLSKFDKNLTEFSKDTNLTPAQLRGEDDIPMHPMPAKWKYEYGKLLVWPQLVKHLPTKMYKLHEWYVEATTQGMAVMEVRIGDERYFHADDIINVLLDQLYMLFNQDVLDKSLINRWILMEIQTYRKNGYHDVGSMDPKIIHKNNLRDKPNRTLKNILKFLSKHYYKKYILLTWNFNFVYVFDSLRKPKEKYADIMDVVNKCWAQFCRTHTGEFKEKLIWNTDFLCLREPPDTNLCGYYFCDGIHAFMHPNRMTDHQLTMMAMKDKLLETEVFRAIQEQLCGFFLDEVANPAGKFHNNGSNLVHPPESGSE